MTISSEFTQNDAIELIPWISQYTWHSGELQYGYNGGFDDISRPETHSWSNATVVSSLLSGEGGERKHKPILDIDFPAALVPSSTEGHYHLYLDHEMTEEAYFKLLYALAEAGIITAGYRDFSRRRGYTSARRPGTSK